LSGYKIVYQPFKNGDTPNLEGFRLPDPFDDSKVHIFYNESCTAYRKRYTQIHETLHICQSLDPYFLMYVDWLLENPLFPKHVVEYMLERVTEKTVAMYMMPEKHFRRKYIENPDVVTLSGFFEASAEAVRIRLQELGLPLISKT